MIERLFGLRWKKEAKRLPDVRTRFQATEKLGLDLPAQELHHELLSSFLEAGHPHVCLKPVDLQSSTETNHLYEALSRSIWGTELFARTLKHQVVAELHDHHAWYADKVPEGDIQHAIELLAPKPVDLDPDKKKGWMGRLADEFKHQVHVLTGGCLVG